MRGIRLFSVLFAVLLFHSPDVRAEGEGSGAWGMIDAAVLSRLE